MIQSSQWRAVASRTQVCGNFPFFRLFVRLLQVTRSVKTVTFTTNSFIARSGHTHTHKQPRLFIYNWWKFSKSSPFVGVRLVTKRWYVLVFALLILFRLISNNRSHYGELIEARKNKSRSRSRSRSIALLLFILDSLDISMTLRSWCKYTIKKS